MASADTTEQSRKPSIIWVKYQRLTFSVPQAFDLTPAARSVNNCRRSGKWPGTAAGAKKNDAAFYRGHRLKAAPLVPMFVISSEFNTVTRNQDVRAKPSQMTYRLPDHHHAAASRIHPIALIPGARGFGIFGSVGEIEVSLHGV